MGQAAPHTIYLKDYTPSAFLISTVELDIAIFDDDARVAARLTIERNPAAASADAPLVLDGAALALESISLNGRALEAADYAAGPGPLTIREAPGQFVL